MQLYDEAKQR